MRLISQVANEIWICDKQKVVPYQGDISSFKMNMRVQLGIDELGKGNLRGDASKTIQDASNGQKQETKPVKKQPSIEVIKVTASAPKPQAISTERVTTKVVNPPKPSLDAWGSDEEDDSKLDVDTLSNNFVNTCTSEGRYIPPHLRNRG